MDELKSQVAMLKNVQRTQAQVLRARKEKWEGERDLARIKTSPEGRKEKSRICHV